MRLPVTVMASKHRKICEAVCTMWRGGECQRPKAAAVHPHLHPDPKLCCRTLAEAQILVRARAAYSKN